MDYIKWIDDYGMDIGDFNISAFESVNMLHTRSKIESVIEELTNEERNKLFTFDLLLITNAGKMFEHISKVHPNSLTDENVKEWWWNLNKVANGEISFQLIPRIEV